MVCFASTDPGAGSKGLSAFVVSMEADGVVVERHLDKMGQRATDTSAVAFDDVVVPAANRLGGEGDGFKIAMQTLDYTRPATAVAAVGVAQAAFELSVEYTRERVQFGMPIAMNQGISFLVADMATEIEASRLLCWQAAWMIDQGEGRKATKYSSFAKRFAADTAMKVTTDAVQVFGGYGYMKEYPVEKLMRDAKLFQIYEGTSQIQRLVIAKEIYLPRAAETTCRGNNCLQGRVSFRRGFFFFFFFFFKKKKKKNFTRAAPLDLCVPCAPNPPSTALARDRDAPPVGLPCAEPFFSRPSSACSRS